MTTGAGVLLWHGKEIPAIIPGLSFDAEKHLYKFHGRPLKSVTNYTSKLQDHSFCNQVDMDWGSSVHNYLYHSDKGTLGDGGDQRMEPYIEGWQWFCDRQGWDTGKMLAEYPLYSPKYLYCGTFDRLFETDKYDWLIDLKTGAPSRVTGLQLAAYGGMVIEHGLTTASRLRLMECCIDNTGKVKPQLFDFKKNWQLFLMQYSLQNYLAN